MSYGFKVRCKQLTEIESPLHCQQLVYYVLDLKT